MNIILSGIVGSTAYGLAGPDSDVDRLGIFAAPTAEFHGLRMPQESIVKHGPDVTFHEAGKAARLMLKANPTVIELLFLGKYDVITHLGIDLVKMRGSFLCGPRVRAAYMGYATAQFNRLLDTGQFASKQRARSAKHARHMLRLLDQGKELYTTGHLTLELANPDWYINHGNRIAADPEAARPFLFEAEHELDQAKTPLPDAPDEAIVNQWLLKVRKAYI